MKIKKTQLVVQEIGEIEVNIPKSPKYFQNWNGREWVAMIPQFYTPEFVEDLPQSQKEALKIDLPHTVVILSLQRDKVIKIKISTHTAALERIYRENVDVKNGKEENFVIEYALNEMIYGNAYSGEVSKKRFYEAFNAHLAHFYKDLEI